MDLKKKKKQCQNTLIMSFCRGNTNFMNFPPLQELYENVSQANKNAVKYCFNVSLNCNH